MIQVLQLQSMIWNNQVLPKIIGIITGILTVGVYARKFRETPLCRS